MDLNEWNGVTRTCDLHAPEVATRSRLADAAKAYDWPAVFAILATDGSLVNSWRLGGKSWYTPLHQAANGGAPLAVVQRLLAHGAWRTLPDACGERALDVAQRHGHHWLAAALAPELKHQVPGHVLAAIQAHFHEVIRGRIDGPLPGHALRLPHLSVLLELERPRMWFPVPAMYGGFNFHFETTGAAAKLVAESWVRVVGGSGQRHDITADGSRLVAEGFV